MLSVFCGERCNGSWQKGVELYHTSIKYVSSLPKYNQLLFLDYFVYRPRIVFLSRFVFLFVKCVDVVFVELILLRHLPHVFVDVLSCSSLNMIKELPSDPHGGRSESLEELGPAMVHRTSIVVR